MHERIPPNNHGVPVRPRRPYRHAQPCSGILLLALSQCFRLPRKVLEGASADKQETQRPKERPAIPMERHVTAEPQIQDTLSPKNSQGLN